MNTELKRILNSGVFVRLGCYASGAILLQGCFVLVPFITPDTRHKESVSTPAMPVPTAKKTVRKVESSPEKVARLIPLLTHPDDVVKVHAAFELGEMGVDAKPAVQPLIENLRNKNHWVRRSAVKALGKIGSDTAIPHLTQALKDPDEYVADSAAKALRRCKQREARTALRRKG